MNRCKKCGRLKSKSKQHICTDTSWNKGKKMSKEYVENLRIRMLKLHKEGKIGTLGRFKKGHIISEESKKKMSLSQKGKKKPWVKPKPIPKGMFAGDKNPNWKGGIMLSTKFLRKSRQYKIFRLAVLERDNYKCIWCGEFRKELLEVDHIKPFALFPELRLAIDNGRVLCRSCHLKTDTYAGKTR